jgi:hypothetical protein
MAGFGIPQLEVAGFLGIDMKTLRKHFREELDRGVVEANAKVAQSLFQMATQGKNVAAAIFWLKIRAGWRERVEIQPILGDASTMTDAELEAIARTGLPKEPPKRSIAHGPSTRRQHDDE